MSMILPICSWELYKYMLGGFKESFIKLIDTVELIWLNVDIFKGIIPETIMLPN